jgi:LPXTG-site transpeptidase (sortase) family protein
VGIAIPAIDVRTDVDVVGLDERDQVEVPEDVARTGWYRFSAKPGSGSGSIVIVGHVDGIDQGAGAFYDLRALRPGDTVTLTRADDRTVTYEVVAREVFSKSKVPLRELFSRSGSERLTLITCGGAFDPAALEYTDNIVVTAVPVDSNAEIGKTP